MYCILFQRHVKTNYIQYGDCAWESLDKRACIKSFHKQLSKRAFIKGKHYSAWVIHITSEYHQEDYPLKFH